MCHQKSWLKNVNHRDRGRRCGITCCWSLKIVVGEVLSCEDVPETHLHVCQVNVGEEEARQIVCGAPNVRAGIKVMVALPGARIAENYKIKKGKSVVWNPLG